MVPSRSSRSPADGPSELHNILHQVVGDYPFRETPTTVFYSAGNGPETTFCFPARSARDSVQVRNGNDSVQANAAAVSSLGHNRDLSYGRHDDDSIYIFLKHGKIVRFPPFFHTKNILYCCFFVILQDKQPDRQPPETQINLTFSASSKSILATALQYTPCRISGTQQTHISQFIAIHIHFFRYSIRYTVRPVGSAFPCTPDLTH